MPNTKPTLVQQLTHLIRRNFQLMKAVADHIHQDIQITAAMRSVLKYLHHHPDQTVPQIAKSKLVSRQHIQVIVDDLAAKGLVLFEINQQHQRSPLVRLSDHGQNIFHHIHHHERSLWRGLGQHINPEELATTLKTLSFFQENMQKLLPIPTETTET